MSYYMKAAKAAKDGNINTFSQLMALGILNDADNGCTMSFLAKSLGWNAAWNWRRPPAPSARCACR